MIPAPDGTTDSPAHSQGLREACEPFNDPDADTILRTSDRVDFRIYKIILSLASPVFRAMFKARQSDPTSTDTPPVFDVPENARTIEYILRCCYPLPSPSITALQDLRLVLYAAKKYGLAAVTSLAKVSLGFCIFLDVLGVFSIASRCELEDVCVDAAKQSLRHKLTSLDSVHLDQISARQLHKLLQYHRQHRGSALVFASSVVWCCKDSCVSTPHWTPPPPRLLKPNRLASRASRRFFEANADVILRSSDAPTDFRVHKLILSLASPIFRDMFELGQADPGTLTSPVSNDALPIIDVTEDSCTLELVLRCIYPVQSPTVEGLHRVRLFLEAGRKYDIVAVNVLAKAALVKCIDEDVLGTFAIALRYNLLDICTMAAEASLKTPLMSLDSTELDHIPANMYHRLLQYHERSRAAASQVISSRTWFTEDILDITQKPSSSSNSSRKYCSGCQFVDQPSKDPKWLAPRQLWDYLKHAGQILEERPHHSMVLSEEVLSKWESPGIVICQRSDCRRIYMRDIFSRALAREVEKAVAEVDIPSFAKGWSPLFPVGRWQLDMRRTPTNEALPPRFSTCKIVA